MAPPERGHPPRRDDNRNARHAANQASRPHREGGAGQPYSLPRRRTALVPEHADDDSQEDEPMSNAQPRRVSRETAGAENPFSGWSFGNSGTHQQQQQRRSPTSTAASLFGSNADPFARDAERHQHHQFQQQPEGDEPDIIEQTRRELERRNRRHRTESASPTRGATEAEVAFRGIDSWGLGGEDKKNEAIIGGA
ncbi:hypothetical protein JCM8547_007122 [Rhodosporidiobolus lusitaniae]